MGRPSGKAPAEADKAVKTDQLLQRVIAGQTIKRAAEDLNIPYSTAVDWYHKALQATFDASSDQRQELLGRELKTLEMLQKALWPAALRGHVRSVEVMLAVMDRRSKYLGFDAATKVQVEVTRVDEALTKITNIIDGETIADAVPLLRAVPDRP